MSFDKVRFKNMYLELNGPPEKLCFNCVLEGRGFSSELLVYFCFDDVTAL